MIRGNAPVPDSNRAGAFFRWTVKGERLVLEGCSSCVGERLMRRRSGSCAGDAAHGAGMKGRRIRPGPAADDRDAVAELLRLSNNSRSSELEKP